MSRESIPELSSEYPLVKRLKESAFVGRRRFSRFDFNLVLASMFLLLLHSTQAWCQEDEETRETFSAFAVSMGTVAPGASTTFQFTIDRWTTDEERNELITTVVEKGSEKLIKVLRDQEQTGFVRVTGRGVGRTRFPSVRLYFARDIRTDGGRIIRLATDRPIGMAEAMRNPRTMDYTFSLIEFRLDENNEGDGTLAIGVKMNYDKEKNTLVLENFSSEPVRLTRVHKTN